MKASSLILALTMISVASVASFSSVGETRDRADRRQSLTRGEAARLQASKRAVRRNERRAEADGTVTDQEAAKLEKMQDARSEQIGRLKNNDKTNSDDQ